VSDGSENMQISQYVILSRSFEYDYFNYADRHLVSNQFLIQLAKINSQTYEYGSAYFEIHRTKLCTVLAERINQTINLISRINNKEFMNVKHL
jgi:hypothetical protein